MKKTVYLYDLVTLAPTTSYDAQESPQELGVFLTPIHFVDTAPPVPGPNQVVFFDGVNNWVVRDLPIPTSQEILETNVANYRLAVRQHMSATAKGMPERFNSISEAKSFSGIDNPYRAVGDAAVAWSADVLVAADLVLNGVLNDGDPLPVLADLITSLPAWVHP